MKISSESYGAGLVRGVFASVIAPGLIPILAYYVIGKLHTTLPDHWARGIFLVQAAFSYILVLPGLWLARLARWRGYAYVVIGCVSPLPLWIVMAPFVPSDITVGPLNPQFMILPMVIFTGATSAMIFLRILR